MKTYLAALLAFLLAFSPAAVHAASAFTLELSAKEVRRGGELKLSGSAPDGSGVVVKIVGPKSHIFYIDVLTPAEGKYSASVTIPASEDLSPAGTYTVAAGSGSESATATFAVAGGGTSPGNPGGDNPGGGGPGTGDPGAGGPGTGTSPGTGGSGGSDAPPAGSGAGIPAGAGEAPGAVVRAEASSAGVYLAGADALRAAAEAARPGGAVTIELPAATAQAGGALEFPAASLRELSAGRLALAVSISGGHTITFPAGAIGAPAGASARVRIELNPAWNTVAQTQVEASLPAGGEYRATGVVLSAVIRTIDGGKATNVRELALPAEVSLKPTAAQAAKIAADLAGVYYADGGRIEYMPGRIANGMFTFKTIHFSTYAVLEYDKTFADLKGHWAESPVKSLSAKHLVAGVDADHYAPARGITRAEFVTLLMRAVEHEGRAQTSANPANPFKDVPQGRYYTEYAAQASALGIVTGYGGKFRPNDSITREEAAVSLVRAAEYFSLPEKNANAAAFTDANDISAWAEAAVNRARAAGLLEGSGGRFEPARTVSRAEVAAMVLRLLPDGTF
ncbi:S-layer homology domain-containing protein [Saccharibacillus sp. CPCC 101409]|uniref:S-layer homology domain-containing protein n=1 Tax=Saccharibacillus sp. CPCC 101409 TaxID=3058041 RepID=UPI002672CD55|nr:S-layer homology domain-containing protein [Saccharibacillus sp. CPCC 101409]MDO3412603.1 S-layer homology domain-containing protein [Saccharibacillus sp. CPCC 101409]